MNGRETVLPKSPIQPSVAESLDVPVQPSHLPDGLIIPVDVPSIEDFKSQFEAAVQDQGCHFYIDTSVLVWLTQIGKPARAQFKDWMKQVGEDRFHVPVWSAHEYFNHHVNGLIGRKLSDAAEAMRQTADRTYSEIRPFLGEPVDERSSRAWTARPPPSAGSFITNTTARCPTPR